MHVVFIVFAILFHIFASCLFYFILLDLLLASFYVLLCCCFTPIYQRQFFVCENLLGNEPDYDSYLNQELIVSSPVGDG